MMSTSDWPARARAMRTRLCCPPERVLTSVRTGVRQPDEVEGATTIWRSVGRVDRASPVAEPARFDDLLGRCRTEADSVWRCGTSRIRARSLKSSAGVRRA